METYTKNIIRPPVAAGRFYSGSTDKLEIEIDKLLSDASAITDFKIPENENLLALIAPHAGYVFSGIVAASAFMQLKEIKPRKKIFLLGSSHHADFHGASIYNAGDYQTPFGNVKVDVNLANKIIENSQIMEFVPVAHAHEHSIEVMLPFLQYLWKDSFEIIPIIIATHSRDICKRIAFDLKQYLTPENLFIISTDLSHYPSYENALQVDKNTVDALITGDPEKLIDQLAVNKDMNIPNLSTSMCGWTSVLTLMYMLENTELKKYHRILYQNSGDARLYGDEDRVVGYQSVAVTGKTDNNHLHFSEFNKRELIDLARQSIKFYLEKKEKITLNPMNYNAPLNTNCGAFVTLYINGELKGCIGRLHSENIPLYETISEMAISSAFFDHRFTPLTADEFNNISIEISVLTPMKKITSIDEFELGKHGIYIKKDFHSGTFLPQVAHKTQWSKEEFIGHCSKDKAGLGWDGWKSAELFIYEAIIIKEELH